MRKAIIFGTIILGAINIVLEFFHIDYEHIESQTFLLYAKGYLSCFNLTIPGTDFSPVDSINYVQLFFYGLLLTGGILYAFSRKETRLLRYLFSIIFLSHCIALPWTFFNIIHFFEQYKWLGFLQFFINLILIGGWLIVCFKVIRFLSTGIPLETVTETHMGTEIEIFTHVSRWKRLFNFLADWLTLVLIFAPSLKGIIDLMRHSDSLAPLNTDDVMARLIIWVLAALLQVLYYMVYEGVFQATPGKFLTGTRVVNADGSKPAAGNIAKRTFSRLVPFESISVLANQSWHDNWSDTHIINEKNEGIKGGYYFLILPLFAVLWFGGYAGIEAYQHKKAEARYEEEFKIKQDSIYEGLKHLTPNHVLTLKRLYEPAAYLKVEKIATDSITFSILNNTQQYSYDTSPQILEKYYSESKDTLQQITLGKEELKEAVIKKDESYYRSADAYGKELLKDGSRYEISEITQWYVPNIELDNLNVTSYNTGVKELEIRLKNSGWKTDLITIKNKNGAAIKWIPELPYTIETTVAYGNSALLIGKTTEIEDVDLELTFKDSVNKIQVYRITAKEGEYRDGLIQKIK